MNVINIVGFSSIFIMPDNLVSNHPFVGESHIDAARADLLAGEVGGLRDTEHGCDEMDVIGGGRGGRRCS